MSIITIHCRLVASELVRRHLWHLMTQSNTPLINDLLKRVSQHSDFETWKQKGTISRSAVNELCNLLKDIYPGQPQRFYASAILKVTYIYESWLATQRNNHWRLEHKRHWLDIVKSDPELMALSGSSLEVIQQRAEDILAQLKVEDETQLDPEGKKESLVSRLFTAYDNTSDVLDRCAIIHLIKNGCKIAKTQEDPKKFADLIRFKQKEVEQLEARLSARLPKGRDLTGEEFLNTLEIATKQISESVAQAREWQAKLLARPQSLPYPIILGSSTDVFWGKTAKGRITVNFNGLDKYLKAADPAFQEWFKVHKEYPFRVYCDRRQLPYFKRFLEDWQAYQANRETYPTSLLTLCSAELVWKEGEGKGDPWNVNHLALHCSFDTRLMTAEGTLAFKQEKLQKLEEIDKRALERARKNSTEPKLDPRRQATRERLQNVPPRPSRKPYQGNSEILVGISIGLTDPVTAVVVNGRTGEVLTERTPQALLGDRYHLLKRCQNQQRRNAIIRQRNKQNGTNHQPSQSELGQMVDHLLAKAVAQLAQQYQAGSIVLPNLNHVRDILSSEITARAEQKCPGSVEAQNEYAAEYQMNIHQWSYRRLMTTIQNKAQQVGIIVESGFQPLRFNPQEQARDVAILTYHSRRNSC